MKNPAEHGSMEKQKPLPEECVREMVRLMADVAIGEKSLVGRRRELVAKLSILIEADCWVWIQLDHHSSDDKIRAVFDIHGGFDETRFARYLEAVAHKQMAALNEPYFKALEENGGKHTTRLKENVVAEDVFVKTPVYPLFNRANIGPLLMSGRSLADGRTSLIALYREASRSPFSETDARVAHIILSEVPWLHESWEDEQSVRLPNLSPRQWIVLNLLCKGMSRKSIAETMGISIHTCNDYVKKVFAFFQVHSQPELILKMCVGDGKHTNRKT